MENMKQSFRDFYSQGVSLKTLKAGAYPVKLLGSQFVAPEKVDGQPYVRLDLKMEDRIINDNRFENNFGIFLTQVKRQLGMEDQDISVQELLKLLQVTEFKIWIDYVTINGRTYRNVNYIAPVPVENTVTNIPKF